MAFPKGSLDVSHLLLAPCVGTDLPVLRFGLLDVLGLSMVPSPALVGVELPVLRFGLLDVGGPPPLRPPLMVAVARHALRLS